MYPELLFHSDVAGEHLKNKWNSFRLSFFSAYIPKMMTPAEDY
jgi:hypothetical protein